MSKISRERDAEVAREAILETAEDVFAREGFSSLCLKLCDNLLKSTFSNIDGNGLWLRMRSQTIARAHDRCWKRYQ